MIHVCATDENISIKCDDKIILTYHIVETSLPEGVDETFKRSGYIHPLKTPGGNIVTDDYPWDHPHQHGMFLAWTSGEYNGRETDLWNQKKKQGRIKHVRTENVFSDGFKVILLHEAFSGHHFTPLIEEEWTVKAKINDGMYIVDFSSIQTCLPDSGFKIKKYHYGGFCIRGNREWNRTQQYTFLTALGKSRDDGNHSPAEWIDMSGIVNGKLFGVTAINHPLNIRSPQKVRIPPDRPYFSFSPMVDDDIVLVKGQKFINRYSIILHDGPMDRSLVTKVFDSQTMY